MVDRPGSRSVTDVVYEAQITDHYEKNITSQAMQFQNKVNQKPNRNAKLFYKEADLTDFLNSPDSHNIRKIQVIGHGLMSRSRKTAVGVGNYRTPQLVEYFNTHLQNKPHLDKISLNACRSGLPAEDGGASMAEELANGLDSSKIGTNVRVGGYHGLAVMQNDGKNMAISQERPASDPQESKWNRQHWQPRPVFKVGDTEGNAGRRAHAASEGIAGKRLRKDGK